MIYKYILNILNPISLVPLALPPHRKRKSNDLICM